jgi:hypothetical protein
MIFFSLKRTFKRKQKSEHSTPSYNGRDNSFERKRERGREGGRQRMFV